ASINLMVCLTVVYLRGQHPAYKTIAAVTAAGLSLAFFGYGALEGLYLKAFYYNRTSISQMGPGYSASKPHGLVDLATAAQGWPTVERLHTSYQTIDFVPYVGNDQESESASKALYINGRFQISDRSTAQYHEPFARAPVELIHRPSRVLILGGGDGALAYQINRFFPEVDI